MFTKFTYTWELMGASFNILRRTKGLLIFPLLSGICCVLVLVSFLAPMVATDFFEKFDPKGASTEQQVIYYAIIFAFYFCNYFVITFFNVAIVAGAMARMAGGEPTIGNCLREAAKRIHLIIGWALVSATVGLLLKAIEQANEKVGRFVASLLGSAWTIMTFLVVPVMVLDQKGPFAALGESIRLLKKSWGEQLVGNFSFGLIFTILSLPATAALAGGVILILIQDFVFGAILLSFGIVAMIILSLVQSALAAIFQTAVYMHTQGVNAEGFHRTMLVNAMSPRD